MVVLMYDDENFEFKFSRVKGHLKAFYFIILHRNYICDKMWWNMRVCLSSELLES